MKQSLLKSKSFLFAVRVIGLSKHVREKQKEFDISRQVLRSGTAIGALVREAVQAESKRDFIHKLSISLKESSETEYWLELLFASKLITEPIYKSLLADCQELLRLLVSSIKTCKLNL